jgi:hypothetical protein
MPKNRQYLPEDWLEIFINRVRSTGVWCDTRVNDQVRHYFICRNPHANIAISKCGQIIATFEKLHENVITKKCLICDLYLSGGKEVNDKIDGRLNAKIDELTFEKE